MSESKYWIWGQLDKNSMDFLNSVYSIINKEFNGPYFDIHITLAGPIKTFDDRLLKKFISFENKLNSVRLNSNKYSFSKNFYESFFVSINNSTELKKLKKILELTFDAKNYIPMPHISLYYGIMNNNCKKNIMSKLPDLPKKMVITSLCLAKVNERANKWDIIQKIELL